MPQDLQEARRALDALAAISRAIAAATLDVPAVMATIVASVTAQLGDACALYVADGDGLRLVAGDHRDAHGRALIQAMVGARLDVEISVSLLAYRERRVVAVAELDPAVVIGSFRDEAGRAYMTAYPPRHAAAAPLAARDEVLGALSVSRLAGSAPFSGFEQWLLEELAGRAALALSDARLVAVRDEFLSIAGHELRTPLTALRLQLDSAHRAAERGNAADAQVRVERALQHTDRVIALVDAILDVSRLGAGRLVPAPSRFVLADAVAAVASRHADELARSGAALTTRLDGVVSGSWDRLIVEQIVGNLLANAIKYGAGKPIELSVEAAGGVARIGVRDHGPGIALADQARIFQRFERAVSSRHYGGLGLGLWIVRELTAILGGNVRLESTPGQGALFVVELPL